MFKKEYEEEVQEIYERMVRQRLKSLGMLLESVITKKLGGVPHLHFSLSLFDGGRRLQRHHKPPCMDDGNGHWVPPRPPLAVDVGRREIIIIIFFTATAAMVNVYV